MRTAGATGSLGEGGEVGEGSEVNNFQLRLSSDWLLMVGPDWLFKT